MPKSFLHLSIDTDLLTLAKQSDLNLSAEFENWVKIRLNQNDNMDEKAENLDFDKEILRLKNEITRLQSKKELQKSEDLKAKELNDFLDYNIDNMLKNKAQNQTLEDKIRDRVSGLKYLYKNKYRKNLNDTEIINMFLDRLKERGL